MVSYTYDYFVFQDSKMCLKCYNDFHKPNTALHPVQQLMRFTLVEMDVLRTPALGSSMNGMKQMRPAGIVLLIFSFILWRKISLNILH